MSRGASQQSGFTLVEILVAMAVFAVMAGIAYGGLSSVIKTRESVDRALNQSKQLQMALWRIQKDVEQTVDRPARNRYGEVEPALTGSADRGLTLTRDGWPNPLSQQRSTLQRVHYQRDADHHLVRAHYRVLDLAQDSEPVSTDLLAGVDNVEWRFRDENGDWHDRWPPIDDGTAPPDNQGAERAPPVAVALELDTEKWGRLRLLFALTGGRP